MEINFEKEYLRELYEQGIAKNKKYWFQPMVVKQYKNTIDKLRVVTCVKDLFLFRSLNYEKLQGDKRGIESVRVNHQYRVEFYSTTEGEGPETITICNIIELSNHYK